MFGTLALWVPVSFLVALAAKFWMEPHGYRLRSLTFKLVLGATALVWIFISYGSIKGIEPGVSLVAVLMSLKILEAHTAREFQVMVMVAWLLCLCGFFLSQDVTIALCLAIAFTLLLVALIQFHRGSSGPFWPPVRTALKLLAQALPLIVALFLFFPRITTPLRFQMAPLGFSATGFSDWLSPGSVTSLANSTGVAFRAEFPDGRIPSPAAMYWRGVVMPRCNGLEWHAREERNSIPYSLNTRRKANEFGNGSRLSRMAAAGCSRLIGLPNRLPAPCSRRVTTCRVLSLFASHDVMKSHRSRKSARKSWARASAGICFNCRTI